MLSVFLLTLIIETANPVVADSITTPTPQREPIQVVQLNEEKEGAK